MSVTAALSAGACASTAPGVGESRFISEAGEERAQKLEDLQSKLFELFGSQLGEQNYDMAAIIYVRAYVEEFMIRADSFPEMTISAEAKEIAVPPFADLWVLDRRVRIEGNQAPGKAIHSTIDQDQYFIGIELAEFSAIMDAMDRSRPPEPKQALSPNSCDDGNFYFVVLLHAHDTHRIYRRVCDENYAADILFAEPLFDLARAEVPEIHTLIDQVWQEISTLTQD